MDKNLQRAMVTKLAPHQKHLPFRNWQLLAQSLISKTIKV
jgi:hypothetical protein